VCAYDRDQPQLTELAEQGISVYKELQQLPQNAFDCIRLEHVAEHLNEPVQVFRYLSAAMKPTGSIVVTVPDFDAWSRHELGPKWCLTLPHHVSQFTQHSLEEIARQAGLSVVRHQRLPIWEIAKGVFEASESRSWVGFFHSFGLESLARRLYYIWARATNQGDYLSVEMKQRHV
jgi:SAM-dependent methyltransferase